MCHREASEAPRRLPHGFLVSPQNPKSKPQTRGPREPVCWEAPQGGQLECYLLDPCSVVQHQRREREGEEQGEGRGRGRERRGEGRNGGGDGGAGREGEE